MIHYWPDPKPLRHFLTDPRMPPRGLNSHARCLTDDLPEEYEIIGVDEGEPPQLVLRVTREFVEATTDYRWHNGVARLTCPACGLLDGKHAKGCAA